MDNSCVIYLVRRGTTQNDKVPQLHQPILGRRIDPALDDDGKQQRRALEACFASRRVTKVFTSPANRALLIAMEISRVMGGVDLHIASELAPVDCGEWSGECWCDVQSSADYEAFVKDPGTHGYPGGENLCQVQKRVVTFIREQAAAFPTDSMAMVTHPDVIRTAVAAFGNIPLSRIKDIDQDFGQITLLRCMDGEISIGAHAQQCSSVL